MARLGQEGRIQQRQIWHQGGVTLSTFAGIDVSKQHLQVGLAPGGENWEVTNDDTDIAAVVERLGQEAVSLVVVEATGGWELPAVTAAAAAGLPVVVCNPREVRDFARALKRLAKTDRIDAAVLAEYAQRVQPQVRPLVDAATQELQALVTRRRQLVGMLTAEKNRLGAAPPRICANIQANIDWLERCLAELNQDIEDTIRSSPIWRAKDRLLQSVPGVGPVLSIDAAGQRARARHADATTARCAGRCRALQPGQWTIPGSARDLGRPSGRSGHAVHGHGGSRSPQSGSSRLLRQAPTRR